MKLRLITSLMKLQRIALAAALLLQSICSAQAEESFARVGSLSLNMGIGAPVVSMIDPANGYAYYGTNSGWLLKIRLSDFQIAQTAALTSQRYLDAAAIDAVAGIGYIASTRYQGSSRFGELLKVRLSDLEVLETLDISHPDPRVLLIDPANGFLYAGNYDGVSKVRISDFRVETFLAFPLEETPLTTGVIDTQRGVAYFAGTKITKVNLSNFSRAGSLSYDLPVYWTPTSAIDMSGGYAYFGTNVNLLSNDVLYKIRLADFAHETKSSFGVTTSAFHTMSFDSSRGLLYIGGYGSPTYFHLARIRVSDMSHQGLAAFESGEYETQTAVLDPNSNAAYLGVEGFSASAGKIVKFRLSSADSGNRAPVITAPVAVSPNPATEGQSVSFRVSAMDPDGDPLTYLWDFGDGTRVTGSNATHIYRVADFYIVTVGISDNRGATITSPFVRVDVTEARGNVQSETNNILVPDEGGKATIGYTLKKAGRVKITVYDQRGRKIKVLVDQEELPGLRQAVWNGKNEDGDIVVTGIYFLVKEGELDLDAEKIVVAR